ncbi:aminotransferase class V-fold PLP-dependent enzyme [Haliangium ochraceum]|uniref:Cysteine desulfurase n=1 Tax=Haliangium ochraceum (strain DSM 14365 / JCM 11303 / SMP-2) TaxID=502025 RepID=D0LPY2_HALO1|nr:aminotransferase class V-fold PLP-dependent enzyme [Haliangium ochraceum]ACY17019.1 Cysteine desulfurase [Haliangium ochraceum DSM 14365]
MESQLDLSFVRGHFPALARGWALFDNAGGSVVPSLVSERVRDYLCECAVQLGASYGLSGEAGQRVHLGIAAAAALVGADPDEIVLGASTTMNVYVLARALAAGMQSGDAIVVTNLDHEANIGAWRALAEGGIEIREWRFRPETMRLELEDLEPLLDERVRLVCFTHVSNVVGAIHDVAAITRRVHEAGALVCVDGVAFAPHRRVDVRALGVDFYLLSLYKTYGPHLGLLYAQRERLAALANQNHFFIGPEEPAYRLEPGNVNHELSASLTGVLAYFDALAQHHHGAAAMLAPIAERLERVFVDIAAHEQRLAAPLLDFLAARPGVRVLGPAGADAAERVPTVAFTVAGRHAREIPERLDEKKLATRWGDFYARRAIDALGLGERGGVVRVSMVHYNSPDEVARLVSALDEIL